MDKDLQNTLKYKLADSKYGRSLSRSLKDLKDLLPVDVKSKQDEIHRLYLLEKKERDAKNKKSQDNDILQSAAGRVKITYRKKISKKKSKVVKRVSKKKSKVVKRISKKHMSKKHMSKKRMSKKKSKVVKRISKKHMSKKRMSKKRMSKKRISKKRVSKERVSSKRMSSKKPSRKLKMYVYM